MKNIIFIISIFVGFLVCSSQASAQMGFLMGYALGSSGGGPQQELPPLVAVFPCAVFPEWADYVACRAPQIFIERKQVSACGNTKQSDGTWGDAKGWEGACDISGRMKAEWRVIANLRTKK